MFMRSRFLVVFGCLLGLISTPVHMAVAIGDYLVAASDEEGYLEEISDVTISLTIDGPAIEGWQLAVCNDVDAVELDEVVTLDLGDPDFEGVVEVNEEGYWYAGVVVSFDDDVLDVGGDAYLARYLLLEPGLHAISICEEGLDSDGLSAFVAGFPEVLCGLDGELSVRAPFIRGDADGNGVVAALLDAIYLLEWGFLSGDATPCVDAADLDDNGAVSALLDALYLLEYAFADGDTPTEPFGGGVCGDDPTADGLDSCYEATCP